MPKMKSLHSLPLGLLLVIAFCVMACGGEKRTEQRALSPRDSIYTHEYIYQIHIDSPYRALALVDTAEKRKLLTPVRADYLRSMVYFNALQRFSTAASYAKKCYEGAVAQQDTNRIMYVLTVYCSASQAVGAYSDALFGARKGIEYAKLRGDISMEGNFLQNVALVYQDMGMYDECVDYLDRSIELFSECMRREGANFSDAQELLFCLLVKMDLVGGDSVQAKKAVKLLPQAAAALDSIKKSKNGIKSLIKQREIEYYGLSARMLHASGHPEKARAYYQKALALIDANDHTDDIQLVPYLLLARRYEEALKCVRHEKSYIEQSNDTCSHYFVEGVLDYERIALYGMGKYKEAAEVAARQLALGDTLEHREKKEQVAEQTVLYQISEKELKLKEQDAKLGKQRAVLIGGAVAVLMLMGMIATVMLYNRKIRRRNKATVRSIEQMTEQQEELTQLRRINMVQPAGVGGKALKGEQMEQYLSELKMQQAVTMLKSAKNISLEEVATQAGFSHVKAFCRQFERRFGLTPAEYKRWYDRIHKNEGAALDNVRKMTEQAQEMKNSFIRNMSHEVRTPLNQISGFVQLLTDTSREISDEEKKTFRNIIMEQTCHLTELLNSLIELSDYEAGKEIESPMALNLMQLSAAFRADSLKLEGVERVSFRVDGAKTVPFHAALSPLSRIVHCLVDNALKFSEKGMVEVISSLDETSRHLTVSVTDQGEGIAAEDAERIFERFCKLNDYVPGAGLGLTLARTIARRLGGTLKLDVAYGKQGARFVLEVPVQE